MFDIRKIQEQAIYNAVKKYSDEVTAKIIVYGEDDAAKSQDNVTWVQSTMQRMEDQFDQTVTKQLRMDCQCGYGMDEKLNLLKELVMSSSNMEQFANQDRAKAAGLSCVNGELFLQFSFCPCPMIAQVTRLKSKTWCQCTAGYSKALFEKAFGCEVDVELLKSIKAGDEICLMRILPLGIIWN